MADRIAGAPVQEPPKNAFQALDKEKKQALIFLVSLGTAMFVTGATSRRMLKRNLLAEKQKAAEAAAAEASAGEQAVVKERIAKGSRAVESEPGENDGLSASPKVNVPPRPDTPYLNLSYIDEKTTTKPWTEFTFFTSKNQPSEVLAPFARSRQLKLWKDQDSKSFFLPNSRIEHHSELLAQEDVIEESLFRHGFFPTEFGVTTTKADLDFNPVAYSLNVFGIATALTLSVFGAGIYALMRCYGEYNPKQLAKVLSRDLSAYLEQEDPSVLVPDALRLPKSEDSAHEDEISFYNSKEIETRARLEQKTPAEALREEQEEWQTLQKEWAEFSADIREWAFGEKPPEQPQKAEPETPSPPAPLSWRAYLLSFVYRST